jgi:hypothetical protein
MGRLLSARRFRGRRTALWRLYILAMFSRVLNYKKSGAIQLSGYKVGSKYWKYLALARIKLINVIVDSGHEPGIKKNALM